MEDRIKSRSNPAVKHIKHLANDRKYRYKHGQFVCEGEKMFFEAASSCAQIEKIYFCPETCPLSKDELKKCCAEITEADEAVLCAMSDLESAGGLVFVCKMPHNNHENRPQNSGWVILDNVQDPGNVGTIIRTADAFSMSVAMTQDCADVFSPKVVRSTMGAIFRANMIVKSKEDIMAHMRAVGIKVYAAALDKSAADIREISGSRSAVIIGNESKGVGEYFLENSDGKVLIPMSGAAQSLNASAAAAICMWEISGK